MHRPYLILVADQSGYSIARYCHVANIVEHRRLTMNGSEKIQSFMHQESHFSICLVSILYTEVKRWSLVRLLYGTTHWQAAFPPWTCLVPDLKGTRAKGPLQSFDAHLLQALLATAVVVMTGILPGVTAISCNIILSK